jgi:hypothetical protein
MSDTRVNIEREPCGDHREFAEETCPTCEEPVDAYGNTAYSFKYCSFPDCGCDGARLCMAGNPNDASCALNIEWRSR